MFMKSIISPQQSRLDYGKFLFFFLFLSAYEEMFYYVGGADLGKMDKEKLSWCEICRECVYALEKH